MKRLLLLGGHYARRLQRDPFPGAAVLCYHGVRPDDWAGGRMAFEGLHVRASEFDAHCRVLRALCTPISLPAFQAGMAGTGPLPPRSVLVTFDDGYRTVATVAQPIFERHGIPAALFVCTAPVQERTLFWYDALALAHGEAEVQRLKAAPAEEWRRAVARTRRVAADGDPHAPLTAAEIRVLARRGVEIGGHSVSHPILSRLPPEEQEREIRDNRAALQDWTGHSITAFAYPNGEPADYSPETVAILRDLNFTSAFTTVPRFVPAGGGLECPRFPMVAGISAAELAHRLACSWPR